MRTRYQRLIKSFGITVSLILSMCLIASASAQKLEPPKAKIIPKIAHPGDTVKLVISIPLSSNLHIYSAKAKSPYFATRAEIKEQGPIIWQSSPIFPKASILNILGEDIEVISPDKNNSVNIIFEGRVKPSANAGKYRISAVLTYQACSENSCLQPIINKEVIANLVVKLQKASVGESKSESIKDIKIQIFHYSLNLSKTNLLLALSIAFLAGLILNIMPCVLPIIPLKILQLVDQAKREQRSAVALSLMFSIGIIAFFLVIGIFAVILQNSFSWGMQFQNTGFVFAMILLLLWLSLGMFSVFEIGLPGFIVNKPIMKSGYPGAFLMGFLGGILSTPCSFGILGAAIAWAQLQSSPITLITFFMIGLGMALPYIILSGIPSLAQKIPQTGRWTELFKQSMGFLLLGVVAFLINALPKDTLFWFLLYFVFFSFIIWLWGYVLRYSKGFWANFIKITAILSLIYTGAALFESSEGKSAKIATSEAKTFNETLLSQTLAKGKFVAVKFTADWCISCKFVESRVYHNSKVQELIRRGILIVLKADLTRKNEFALKKLKEWTGQTGVPFTVLFYPNGQKKLFPGKFSPDDLIKAITDYRTSNSENSN